MAVKDLEGSNKEQTKLSGSTEQREGSGSQGSGPFQKIFNTPTLLAIIGCIIGVVLQGILGAVIGLVSGAIAGKILDAAIGPATERFWGGLYGFLDTHLIRSIWKTPWPVDRRARVQTVLGSLLLHLHPTRLPRHAVKVSYTWCMGGLTFYLMILLTVTGILLMFYYRPTVQFAYLDMKYLMNDVPFGKLMRNMHRWSAHLMLITVWLHMLRVFLTGSYKAPREFNWVVGVILLVLTMLLSFSGYLLPWDQLSIWAVTVGSNMALATPFMGSEGPGSEFIQRKLALATPSSDVRFALLGGTVVGENALLRFYVLHCVLFPIVHGFLMAMHFWRVRKDGGISGPL